MGKDAVSSGRVQNENVPEGHVFCKVSNGEVRRCGVALGGALARARRLCRRHNSYTADSPGVAIFSSSHLIILRPTWIPGSLS